MITTIYIANDPTHLARLANEASMTPTFARWPELISTTPRYMMPDANRLPLGAKQIIARCPHLVGLTVVTMSEYVILWMMREVGCKRMKPEDLRIVFIHGDGRPQQIRVDEIGELIDRWPGGFFDERADLLFYDPDEVTS